MRKACDALQRVRLLIDDGSARLTINCDELERLAHLAGTVGQQESDVSQSNVGKYGTNNINYFGIRINSSCHARQCTPSFTSDATGWSAAVGYWMRDSAAYLATGAGIRICGYVIEGSRVYWDRVRSRTHGLENFCNQGYYKVILDSAEKEGTSKMHASYHMQTLLNAVAEGQRENIIAAIPDDPFFLNQVFALERGERSVVVAGLFSALDTDDLWEIIEAAVMDIVTKPERGSFLEVARHIPPNFLKDTLAVINSLQDSDARSVAEDVLRDRARELGAEII